MQDEHPGAQGTLCRHAPVKTRIYADTHLQHSETSCALLTPPDQQRAKRGRPLRKREKVRLQPKVQRRTISVCTPRGQTQEAPS